MKTITRPLYRAVFQQPTGKLNPLGARFSCDIEVEIYRVGSKWLARRPNTSAQFAELGEAGSHSSMKTLVAGSFERRTKPWSAYDKQGNPIDPATIRRTLEDGSIEVLEPEDFTHIQNTGVLPPGKNMAVSLCGGKFNFTAFASTLPNAPAPTCAACAALRRREAATA